MTRLTLDISVSLDSYATAANVRREVREWAAGQDERGNEIRLHVAPVLLGAGIRLFEDLGDEHLQLELIDAMPGSMAMHLRYASAERAATGISPRSARSPLGSA